MNATADHAALVAEARAYLEHAPFNFPEGVSLIDRLAAALQAPRGDEEPEGHFDPHFMSAREKINALAASLSREAVARIIDPTAFEPMTGHIPVQRQKDALAKADAILALALPPAPQGWRDISELPENENLILAWIDEFDAPEVWVATLYFEALRSDAPHMAHLKAQAKTIHWWMYAPKSPYPHPAAPTQPEEAR